MARKHLTPPMAVSLIALFVALGGVGYAAARIGSAQIKNNSITGADVRNSSLTGRDVKNDSLGGGDVKESALGKVGFAGVADTAGRANTLQGLGPGAFLQGSQLAGRVRLSAQGSDSVTGPDTEAVVNLQCPAGTVAIGASARITGLGQGVLADSARSASSAREWQVRAVETADDNWVLTAQAVCLG